jgi:hypothetical protein
MDKRLQNIQKIQKKYEKLTYFDQYGGSLLLFILITCVVIVITSYCIVMSNVQPIIDDWPNQRCNPTYLPFAGLITHPNDVSAADYTSENFTYCVQNITSSISGFAVEPINFTVNILNKMANFIKVSLQSVRDMFAKVRKMFQDVSEELMGRIMNIMVPLQQIIIGLRDFINKTQGTMTGGLFTLLGSYYTLSSLMGAIAQFVITILIALAIMIAVFWLTPFTIGAAIANTGIFIAISIPMAIILAFMVDVLRVRTSLSIPKIKCFDKNTLIDMNDGTKKKISNIKNGDKLLGDNEVTSCIKVTTEGSQMYKLNDIIVSDSHIVKYNDAWIPVSKHPNSVKYASYYEPYLYCLNTTNKVIVINKYIFSDWDEINEDKIFKILRENNIIHTKDIHSCLDGGFTASTKIKLQNKEYKKIKHIKINDVLENGEVVYGLVKINGDNVVQQYKFNLGNKLIKGGPNLLICKNKQVKSMYLETNKKIIKKQKTLYHLLTNSNTYNIDQTTFYDYNGAIDLFLEKKYNL